MQGFNMGRYVPPEHEGTVSANKLAGKHALGNRARKLDKGVLTVRFEMPFPIWCTTCQPHPLIIGQGVRFNAEKKKIGNYYSTPIYSFRMKHTICGGWIEIQTDPKNTAYVVVSGAKKRDTGEDKDALIGEIKIRTASERERLENDPFAALDVKVEDQRLALNAKSRVEGLKKLRDRDWSDPYEGSKKLRKVFREERSVRHKNAAATEELKDRMSLGIELLDEAEEDRQRAKLVDFDRIDSDTLIARAKSRPLFASPGDDEAEGKEAGIDKGSIRPAHKKPTNPPSRKPRALAIAQKSRERLHRELRANTRAALDPFFVSDKDWSSAFSGSSGGNNNNNGNKPLTSAMVVKRKRYKSGKGSDVVGSREEGDGDRGHPGGGALSSVGGVALGLADYDSD